MRLGQKIMGKELEYAMMLAIRQALQPYTKVIFHENRQLTSLQERFEALPPEAQETLLRAANAAYRILSQYEPGLNYVDQTPIELIASGENGQKLIYQRGETKVKLSCVNHELSERFFYLTKDTDLGLELFKHSFSKLYFDDVAPIFDQLAQLQKDNDPKWDEIEAMERTVYRPILEALRKELLRLAEREPMLPNMLTRYVLGGTDFYKIVPNEGKEETVVLPINFYAELNRPYLGRVPSRQLPCNPLPTRLIYAAHSNSADNAIEIICDNDWLLSARLQTLHSHVEPQLLLNLSVLAIPKHVRVLKAAWNK